MQILKLILFKPFAILFFTISVLGIGGCDDDNGVNLFTIEDDKQLGAQVNAEILSNPQEYPILNNSAATAYVQGIIDKLIASPEVKYESTFPYQVRIIHRDDVINAFCLPGGYIYVYTGLIKFFDNEASLAGVLGHEIGHAEARHATERLTKQYGVSVLIGVILGQNPSMIEEITANLLTGFSFLYNSREDEYESDELSFDYMKSTEYYPGALVYFFDKIGQNSSGTILDELLSTHPLPQNRLDKYDDMILKANLPMPSELNLFSGRYQQFKSTLP